VIPVCVPFIGEEELEYVTDCVKTNWISSKGKYVEEFEKKFANYCGCKYGIATTIDPVSIKSAGIIFTFTKISKYCNRQKFGVESLLYVPNTSYPLLKRNFAKYAPSCPVIPVIKALFIFHPFIKLLIISY